MNLKVIVLISFGLSILYSSGLIGQQKVLKGYVEQSENSNRLDDVTITIEHQDLILSNERITNLQGMFEIKLPNGLNYEVTFRRTGFSPISLQIDSSDIINKFASGLIVSMDRLPGYLFEGTVKELLTDVIPHSLGKEVKNIRIEVFNNTSSTEEIIIEDDPRNTFEVNFERGNHYTVLIRKKGYFAKRIEVYVNINGCILCFEGLGGRYAPEIEDAISSDNGIGSLIADIPFRKIKINEAITLDNIYYDYDKWTIRTDARPALNELVDIMKRNPIIIDLDAHTDSRGQDEYNLTLSQKRAQAVVDYVIRKGIDGSRLTPHGYGETMLLNHCDDGVQCTEKEHQLNRRTEFKVTRLIEVSSFDNKSLSDIIAEEKISKIRMVEELKIRN